MSIVNKLSCLRWGLLSLGCVVMTGCGGGSGKVSSSSFFSSAPSSVSSNSSIVQSSSVATSSRSSSSIVYSSTSSSQTSSSSAGNAKLVVAIDSGSTVNTQYEGVTYQADQYYSGGNTTQITRPIAGVVDDALFHTERYGNFSYKIPVTAGTYSIQLHLAEIYWEAAGKRAFNLSIEGQVKLSNFDLYSQVGRDGAFNYLVENVRITDGFLDIAVEGLIDAGTLSGFAAYSPDGKLDTSVVIPADDCKGYVGITYDDGPVNTAAFVNALKQAKLVPVTFFVNGTNIGSNTNAIKQMLTVGEVQSHAFTHVDMGSYSAAQVRDQLDRNSKAIVAAGAPQPTVFRPPYGTTNDTIRQVARELGMITITWDNDSKDWNGASTSAIVSANGQLQNGQVILMHENQTNSLSAIPQIAANLKSRGMCPGKIDPKTGRAVKP